MVRLCGSTDAEVSLSLTKRGSSAHPRTFRTSDAASHSKTRHSDTSTNSGGHYREPRFLLRLLLERYPAHQGVLVSDDAQTGRQPVRWGEPRPQPRTKVV